MASKQSSAASSRKLLGNHNNRRIKPVETNARVVSDDQPTMSTHAVGAGSDGVNPKQGQCCDGGGTSAARRCSRDEREALFNGRARGPAHEIEVGVDRVAAIHGFLIDIDREILDPDVIGEAAAESSQVLYEEHVRHWLDRDPILAKAEVRDTGGGLHVLPWLDLPILCSAEEARQWDRIARGVRNALPGDPNVNGIIAMTRPVGAVNTKYDPPREVRLLREGAPVTRSEMLELHQRVANEPARFWMKLFFGDLRASPCPMCNGEASALGVAGDWRCRCYKCGTVDPSKLVLRFFSEAFLKSRRRNHG